ncbi:hypothetical protein KQ944_18650 [Bacillus subtilis]|uniref:hypothetical protein n=1 Tax=Pseudochrobactrum asaccharolyticum TaxID=354351 RepID=UPI001F17C625|nr:hypothetical protein [Pseudochrobactrum asaccharolyticum]MCF7647434.1 hypothetical protein [Pseudochrobactrum asaccharolyticum]MCF7673659.1 hypothetical protein [Bacillus subtilis]
MELLPEFGGAVYAMAVECGSYSADQLKEMKVEQQSSSLAGGLPAEEFDTISIKGYEGTKVKSAAGDDNQKMTMREQLKKMQN